MSDAGADCRSARPASGLGAPWLLLLACALPHAMRAAWPLVEFGGGDTLLAARRLGSGTWATTASDGPLLFERLLGPLLTLVDGSPRVFELATLACVLGTAWLLRAVGRRLAGPWAGAVAALAWSCHPWVLQRHLFDRGLLAAPLAALALWLLVSLPDARSSTRRTLALALTLLAALVIDTPFDWPLVATAGLWLVCTGHLRQALLVTLMPVALVAALTWSALGLGPAALLIAPAADLATTASQHGSALAAHTDLLLLLAVVAALTQTPRRAGAAARLPALLLALTLVRAWGRLPEDGVAALIGPALPAALLVGLALEAALGGVDRGRATLRNVAVGATALLMALVIFDVFGAGGGRADAEGARPSLVRTWLTDRWRPPQEGYGLFGGRPRSHLDARVTLLREHSRREDRVTGAWAWEAAAADRPYWTARPTADVTLWLAPLPAGVRAEDLAAEGWRRVTTAAEPDVGAWLR